MPLLAAPSELDLTLRSEEDARAARLKVRSLASSLGFDERGRAEIVLAIAEACINGIRHGAGRRGPHVRLTARVEGPDLVAEVSDRGKGFPSGPPRMAEASAESGRGIAMMHALMDDVEIESGAGGTTVRLRKRLPG
jgi:serine/threonine-protein kinase RsbW